MKRRTRRNNRRNKLKKRIKENPSEDNFVLEVIQNGKTINTIISKSELENVKRKDTIIKLLLQKYKDYNIKAIVHDNHRKFMFYINGYLIEIKNKSAYKSIINNIEEKLNNEIKFSECCICYKHLNTMNCDKCCSTVCKECVLKLCINKNIKCPMCRCDNVNYLDLSNNF